MLKKAALGRMCTIMKKQKQTLEYLEEVIINLFYLVKLFKNIKLEIIS